MTKTQQLQDYRSEGEQPSTTRDGVTRRSNGYEDYYDAQSLRQFQRRVTKQDSFRAARMPKRGESNQPGSFQV